MLHEVLLALSGHPSPLFTNTNGKDQATDFPLVSPSEKALLHSIGELSELHRKLRQHIEEISSSHTSTICRAVATSIRQTHLARFQQNVLDVEGKILTKDASIVGAYDIVPLAGVVAEFEDWHRRIAWYWEVACFMKPDGRTGSKAEGCSGAGLIDKLRMEQQTGFPDVEAAAVELSRVAETAWLRQLASWVLYGKVPAFGASDFFIHVEAGQDGDETFARKRELLPKFVSPQTATSILFIGKSLHQVQRYGRQALTSNASNMGMPERELAALHLGHLTSLAMPIISAQLSRTIATIRISLSQNVLQHLLPVDLTLEMFTSLRQFYLLGSGEFATTLITEADSRIQARQQSMGRLLQQDPVKALQGLSIKDAELQQTLSAVWKSLASQDEDAEDDRLEFARKHISLEPPRKSGSRPSTADSVHGAGPDISHISFQDLLFPSAAGLGFSITQPLNLLISQHDIGSYATINAYLLATRRAILRLSDLWRRTIVRRDYPAPLAHSQDALTEGEESRARLTKRRVATRKVWATCSAALFLLSETSAYFEGEITRESWSRFEAWVKEPATSSSNDDSGVETEDSAQDSTAQKDPETLASGHRIFLASLIYALLLNDIPYTRDLRSLLGNVDNLIAFFTRLLDIQQKLDLEHGSGGETGYTVAEEQRISLELDRARKKVDSDLKAVINRLRQLDQERIGSGRYLDLGRSESGFEPWKGGGVDRLLMKLEFGRMVEEGFDIV